MREESQCDAYRNTSAKNGTFALEWIKSVLFGEDSNWFLSFVD